jgi:hypothetical protein
MLPLAVAGAELPLGPTVVVLDEEPAPPSVIVAANAAAQAMGVHAGLRLSQARQRGALQVLHATEQTIDGEQSILAELLYAYAPAVEHIRPHAWGLEPPVWGVFVDLARMLRPTMMVLADMQRVLHRAGHDVVMAASPSKALSLAMAVDAVRRPERWHGRLLHAASPLEVLPRLSVCSFGLSAEQCAWLGSIGVDTAAQAAALLDDGLVDKLGGPHAAGFLCAALRAEPGMVQAMHALPPVVEQRVLEDEVDTIEPLLFVLQPMIERVLLRLEQRRQALASLEVELQPPSRPGLLPGQNPAPVGRAKVLRVGFPTPLRDPKAVARTVRAHLERMLSSAGHEDAASIGALCVRVHSSVTRRVRQAVLQLPTTGGQQHQHQALQPRPSRAIEAPEAPEAMQALVAEWQAQLGTHAVGCLQVTARSRPEDMTRLVWPWPSPAPESAPKRRRPHPQRSTSSQHPPGGFLCGWPWPVRVLPVPIPLTEPVLSSSLLARMEGTLMHPYRREYRVLSLADGRRALGLFDDETEEMWVQGWFD